jgi:peptide/nickel transport system substrate-binding protein
MYTTKSRTPIWLTLILVFGLLLGACAAPATAPATAPAAAPAPAAEAPAAPAAEAPAAAPAAEELTRANTLLFATDATDLISLDPAVAYEFGGIQVVGSIYETLVSFEPGQPGVKPLLAESWDIAETADGSTVTFHLNPAATFASGNPVTAQDVAFSWARAIDINKSPAFLLTDISAQTKETFRAVDASTFQVDLPATVSPQVFLSVISFSLTAVVEQAVVEANMGDDMGSAWMNDNSAGSGPYVLTAWDRSVSVTMDANSNYWGTAPAMKRVIMQNIPELANLQAAIETGDIDIAQDLGPEQAAMLDGNPDVVLTQATSTLLAYVGMNATKAPLDNADVREAIRYAVNYDDIATLLKGNGKIVQEIIPEGFLGFTGNNPFSQDIDKAKELLAKAGVAEGTEIDFMVPTGTGPGGLEWSVLGAKIQADLALAGLTVNIQQLQTSELLNIYRAQGGELTLMNWGPDFPDPDGNATPFANWDATSLAWRNDWNDAKAIELTKQAAQAGTTEERIALYAELVDYVQHFGPYVMLYQPTRTFGIRSNVTGFLYDASDTPSITFANIGKK